MKRILLFLLSLIMLFSVFVISACKNDGNGVSEGLEYAEVVGGYEILSLGTCGDVDIIIPSTYNGKPVISIAENAFYNCQELTSIIIPNSVISIGSHAFYGCNNLKYNIADGLKYLGNDQNKYLYLVGANDKNITDAIINENCRFIGDDAFVDCWLLDNVTIPNGVISIGDSAFSSCWSIISITIPSSVVSIGNSAFLWCTRLKNVALSDGLIFIGDSAFMWCNKLTSVIIPNSVTSIEDYAFSNCKSLVEIVIPNSVINAGDNMIKDCNNPTIYCEAIEKPIGWNDGWNTDNYTVVWGYNN